MPRFKLCLDAVSYPIVAKWSTENLGTTADEDRLSYQDMATATPAIRSLSLPMTLPDFDIVDYDNGFQRYNTDIYSVETHQHSRRMHLPGRWGLVGLIVLFLLCATLSQKRKDRIWQVQWGGERPFRVGWYILLLV